MTENLIKLSIKISDYNNEMKEFDPLRNLDRLENRFFRSHSNNVKDSVLGLVYSTDENFGVLLGEIYKRKMLSAPELVFFIHSMKCSGVHLFGCVEKRSFFETILKNKNDSLFSELFDSIFNFIEKKSIPFFIKESRERSFSLKEKNNKKILYSIEKKALGDLENLISIYIEDDFNDESVEKRICAYLENNKNYLLVDRIIGKSFAYSKDKSLFKKYFNALNVKYKYLISNYIPINFMFVYDKSYDKNIVKLTNKPDLFFGDENDVIDFFMDKIKYLGVMIESSFYKTKKSEIKKDLYNFKSKFNHSDMDFSNNEIITNLFNESSNELAEKILNFVRYFMEENKEKTMSEIKSFYSDINDEIKLNTYPKSKRIQLHLFELKSESDFFDNIKFYKGKERVNPLEIKKIESNAIERDVYIRLMDIGLKRVQVADFINEAMPYKIKEYNDNESLYLNLSNEDLDWIELNLAI